jgi:apolipoprotein N-acyltransferase
MKKQYWALLVLSAILYAIPFLWSNQLWWLIFMFPIPLLYIVRTENLSFIHGYVWGLVVFALHLSAGICIIARLAGDSWPVGLLLGTGMVLYQALCPALLFFGATKIIGFFSFVVRVMQLILLKRIFFFARPELVEGYLRALEEHPSTSSGRAQRERNAVFTAELVEVSGRAQRERNAVFTAELVEVSGRAQREVNMLVRLFVWTITLAIFIFWVDRYCLWILGVAEGYPLMHPLVLFAQRPCLLLFLPILGKQLLTVLFLLIPASVVTVLWYKNYKAGLFFMSAIALWVGCLYVHIPEIPKADWHHSIKSLPCMMHSTVANPLVIIKIIGRKLKDILTDNAKISIIIMPESAFDNIHFEDIPELLQLWSCEHIGKPLHIIFGACRPDNGHYYNTVHWVNNGMLQACFDKKHAMPLTERLPQMMNNDYIRNIYFSDGVCITPSRNERIGLPLVDNLIFIPYICSELFFNHVPDDCYQGMPIILIINDTLFSDSYMQELLVLLARFRAIEWQREILYVSYGRSLFINKCGLIFFCG